MESLLVHVFVVVFSQGCWSSTDPIWSRWFFRCGSTTSPWTNSRTSSRRSIFLRKCCVKLGLLGCAVHCLGDQVPWDDTELRKNIPHDAQGEEILELTMTCCKLKLTGLLQKAALLLFFQDYEQHGLVEVSCVTMFPRKELLEAKASGLLDWSFWGLFEVVGINLRPLKTDHF